MVDLFEQAWAPGPGVALVAVGGHGRRELCPFSDLDLLVVHRPRVAVDDVDRLWYPMWDAGFRVGHAVRTPADTLAVAERDLATATALLSARVLAGDAEVGDEVVRAAAAHWHDHADRHLEELAVSLEERHRRAGEVAFDLEPDLKDGRGGLRDAHVLRWAAQADAPVEVVDVSSVADAEAWLLAVRVELHRATGRPGDRLLLQEQDAVAAGADVADADVLMARVASGARTIAWACDDLWSEVAERASARRRRRPRPVELAPGLWATEGRLELGDGADLTDPCLVPAAAAAAARAGVRLPRQVLDALGAVPPLGERWPAAARDALVDLLLAGDATVPTVEALDRAGLFSRMIPEWEHTRSLPQRNAYHHWTVDRHLLETVVVAARLADRVTRPDLLVLGALLHDVGKGLPGDHAEVGVGLARGVMGRLGYPPDDIDTVAALVEHHLLLPDVATRRDLDDPATIRFVVERAGSVERVRLLAALTEADSTATGSSAWGSWKAGLVAELADRAARALGGGPEPAGASDAATLAAAGDLEAVVARVRDDGAPVIHTGDDHLVVACADRPGLFSRVAAVLAINGLDVVAAEARSVGDVAVEEFRVSAAVGGPIRWDRVAIDLDAALAGRLALSARLAERARVYRRRAVSARRLEPTVRFINDLTDEATVIEVVGPDSVGLLHRLTRALAELAVDIRTARVTTIGSDAVDTFYVRDAEGTKIWNEAHLAEIRMALLHELRAG